MQDKQSTYNNQNAFSNHLRKSMDVEIVVECGFVYYHMPRNDMTPTVRMKIVNISVIPYWSQMLYHMSKRLYRIARCFHRIVTLIRTPTSQKRYHKVTRVSKWTADRR